MPTRRRALLVLSLLAALAAAGMLASLAAGALTASPAELLAALSGSAPGLKFNNIAPLFMVKDKAALKRWLAAQAASRPPRWLIPAHGDIVDFHADPQAARALFAAP